MYAVPPSRSSTVTPPPFLVKSEVHDLTTFPPLRNVYHLEPPSDGVISTSIVDVDFVRKLNMDGNGGSPVVNVSESYLLASVHPVALNPVIVCSVPTDKPVNETSLVIIKLEHAVTVELPFTNEYLHPSNGNGSIEMVAVVFPTLPTTANDLKIGGVGGVGGASYAKDTGSLRLRLNPDVPNRSGWFRTVPVTVDGNLMSLSKSLLV